MTAIIRQSTARSSRSLHLQRRILLLPRYSYSYFSTTTPVRLFGSSATFTSSTVKPSSSSSSQSSSQPASSSSSWQQQYWFSSNVKTASAANNPNNLTPQQEKEIKGAWAVLAALEKSKEAQGVKLAQLINGLETLLPRDSFFDDTMLYNIDHHVTSQAHTSDPAFFSLPDSVLSELLEQKTLQHDPLKQQYIRQLLQATRQGRRVSLETCEALINAATKHFKQQPAVVKLPSLDDDTNTDQKKKKKPRQVTVIGDLHGSLSDLEAVLGLTGEPADDENILIFNGDLADRGDHGLEVIVMVCALVLAYPKCVHVNRGNHEDLALSFAYGLSQEVKHKYGPGSFRKRLGPQLDDLFRVLPAATVIEKDTLIVHAGPPPPGIGLSDIGRIIQPNRRGLSRTIKTNQEVDDNHLKGHELLEALVWSDPIVHHDTCALADDEPVLHDTGNKDNSNNQPFEGVWIPNRSRGAGHKYDATIVRNFLQSEGLFRLVRSHEPVHQGCVRYEISRQRRGSGSKSSSVASGHQRPLEFFTVFSASRYPHKEGFNQGALLVLQPNGKHRILRYATEEDEPKVSSEVAAFDEKVLPQPPSSSAPFISAVDTASIRRALQRAAASYRGELTQALEELDEHYVTGIPFERVVDVLIQILRLDEPGIQKPGAHIALARAMSIECHDTPPDTIDAMACLDALIQDEEQEIQTDGYSPESAPYYPWLRAVFEKVDKDHDGILNKAEWMQAVAIMNDKLPPGAAHIKADDLWSLLDVNADGQVNADEWDRLSKALRR